MTTAQLKRSLEPSIANCHSTDLAGSVKSVQSDTSGVRSGENTVKQQNDQLAVGQQLVLAENSGSMTANKETSAAPRDREGQRGSLIQVS